MTDLNNNNIEMTNLNQTNIRIRQLSNVKKVISKSRYESLKEYIHYIRTVYVYLSVSVITVFGIGFSLFSKEPYIPMIMYTLIVMFIIVISFITFKYFYVRNKVMTKIKAYEEHNRQPTAIAAI
jgi:hypothetical protein